jgi:hypothetical protein
MLAGLVPVSQSLALRVALVVQGVDVEFGESARGYQRFDIFDADRLRTESVLSRFPNVRTGKARIKVKTADASLLGRPKLENRRDTSND